MELFVCPPEGIVGYTAGLIDGEGSIYFSGGRFKVSIFQSSGNNGKSLFDRLQGQWGIGRIYIHLRKGSFSTEKKCWIWSINRAREVEHLLVTCQRYFRVKRKKADEAIRHLRSRLTDERRVVWAPGEDAYLRVHWQDTDEAIGREVRRSAAAVRHRRRKLGFPAKPPGGLSCSWSEDEDAYIRNSPSRNKQGYRNCSQSNRQGNSSSTWAP